MSNTDFLTIANAVKHDLIHIRRSLHTMPEIAWGEHQTAAYICKKLDEIQIPYITGVGQTGIVGLIKGANSGKTLLLRADMDALPIHEQTGADYTSQNPGMMHACGHDAHVTCLLGAARMLNDIRGELSGNIKLMFQPAEEAAGGAEPMIADGVLENPHVDAAIALHVEPGFNCGDIAVRYSAFMASPDEFTITIKGKGGHGAYPHEAVDPILTAAKFIEAVQSINSRYISATTPAVVSICVMNAGSLYNIIPDSAVLKGTTRSIDPVTRAELPRLMERMLAGICAAMGAEYELDFRYMYPPLINDSAMTDMLRGVAETMLGGTHVIDIAEPVMGGEDFSYVANAVPATYFNLGCGNKAKGIVHSLHNPKFNIDEDCLPIGAAMLAAAAAEWLELQK